MKPNTVPGKYKHIHKLPKGAMKIKDWAKKQNITDQYIYGLRRRGMNVGWDIAVYMGETIRPEAIHGRNYVVPA